jgi:hypothetical protein
VCTLDGSVACDLPLPEPVCIWTSMQAGHACRIACLSLFTRPDPIPYGPGRAAVGAVHGRAAEHGLGVGEGQHLRGDGPRRGARRLAHLPRPRALRYCAAVLQEPRRECGQGAPAPGRALLRAGPVPARGRLLCADVGVVRGGGAAVPGPGPNGRRTDVSDAQAARPEAECVCCVLLVAERVDATGGVGGRLGVRGPC